MSNAGGASRVMKKSASCQELFLESSLSRLVAKKKQPPSPGGNYMGMMTIAAMLMFTLQAPQLPDGEDLMKLVREAAQSFTSLQFDSEKTIERVETDSSHKLVDRPAASVAWVKSGKSREEANRYGQTTISVMDGEIFWLYDPDHKEYMKTRVTPRAAVADPDTAGLSKPHFPAPRTLREETIEIDGQKYDCWVVETRIEIIDPGTADGRRPGHGSNTVRTEWIDKKLLVQRQSTASQVTQIANRPSTETFTREVYKNYRINEPIPDSMFSFTPPPDAKEVKSLPVRPKPSVDLVGQEAPDFQVKGLDAKQYSLSALKGKPVLLDFWATWCGPCLKSLPVLEKLYRDFTDQGLVILAVNVGEQREAVDAFLKQTPLAYPAVLSADSGIREAYHSGAVPSFVLIGRDGRILAQQIGFYSEAELREMIAKAGLTAPSKRR
jgi:thiol-disulfide isomerase/thioredoxin